MSDTANTITPQRALAYFFYLAHEHCHGAARVAARLLLSCYNGHRFEFDITDLRLLDEQHLDMALQIMRHDAHIRSEVHEQLNAMYGRTDFGPRFEQLAWTWRLKGKCKKEWLSAVEPLTFPNPLKEQAAH